MAFFPANLPDVTITTLPVLKLNNLTLTFFPFNGYKYQYYIKLQHYFTIILKNQLRMKFSKSQRNIHQPNYNPPCNVYQTENIINNNTILTGSLAMPSFVTRNTFGFENRFQKDKVFGPGPGTYTQDSNKLREKINVEVKNKLYKGKQFPNFGTPPSIPFQYYGQNSDQEETQYIHQLLMNQNISEASKTIRRKGPSFTFTKTEKTHSYIPKIQTNQPKNATRPEDINYYYAEEQVLDQNMKKNKIIWQEKIKRANQRRLQVIQSIDPEFVPSLQLIELIKKKTDRVQPGPGDYTKSQNTQPEFQIYQNPKGASFTSVKRFVDDKPSALGPGIYHPKDIQTSKKFSFGKSSRNVFEQKDETNFRFYINPEPEIDKQASVKHNQRSLSCPFGSRSTRFPQTINNQGPALTLQEQIKRKENDKINKVIKAKLKAKMKIQDQQKDEGLLGISTMASTID